MNDIRELTIQVRDTSPFHFGMKLYVIDSHRTQTFFEKCPICDDAKEIEYKGRKLPCPLCKDSYYRKTANCFFLIDYCITEYIINQMEIKGENTKSLYEGSNILDRRFTPRVIYSGFTRKGNSYDSIQSMKFGDYNTFKEDCPAARPGTAFLSKSEARKCIRRLHQQQEEALKKFNQEHGTDHAYPFEYK